MTAAEWKAAPGLAATTALTGVRAACTHGLSLDRAQQERATTANPVPDPRRRGLSRPGPQRNHGRPAQHPHHARAAARQARRAQGKGRSVGLAAARSAAAAGSRLALCPPSGLATRAWPRSPCSMPAQPSAVAQGAQGAARPRGRQLGPAATLPEDRGAF